MQAGGGGARADLHTHSTASDGLLAPARLVRLAHERGLSVLALTDHDTTLGIDEALRAGEELGVRVIPGVELSTDAEPGQLHMLGYGIDHHDATLLGRLAALREARGRRAGRIIERLAALGARIDPQAATPTTAGESVGRPHIARALVAAGHATSVADAFDRYLGEGKPAYVPSERLAPTDAARLVISAGGFPVLAHPHTFPGFEGMLPELIAAGLAGIEAHHGEADPQRALELERLAIDLGLLVTGGSDFHGDVNSERRALGNTSLPEWALAAFLERIDSRRRDD